jgi:hypothetical protein
MKKAPKKTKPPKDVRIIIRVSAEERDRWTKACGKTPLSKWIRAALEAVLVRTDDRSCGPVQLRTPTRTVTEAGPKVGKGLKALEAKVPQHLSNSDKLKWMREHR